VADRKQLGLVSACDDETRLKLHAFRFIGEMPLEDVRPRHLRDMVLAMRKEAVMAPRSIRKVYATVVTMFRTAVADELVPFTPCVLAKGILPKNIDRDPSFRANAIFTREEVQTLISDVRILEDRRVVYALKALAALRHSEASGLLWRHYDTEADPLGALNLERTKTQVPRRVPVHQTLARILRDWREGGWERIYGRPPTDDDFIVPTRNMTERLSPESQNAFGLDLKMLGLRHRRGHDLRRTFITLAQVDGARRDLLETITHGPRGNIINVYTTFPWPALCAEVAKLRITKVRTGVAKIGSKSEPARRLLDGELRSLATGLATAQRNWLNRWRKSATPAGFEPDNGPNRFADLQKRIEKLGVPLGAVGIAWRHRKAVQMGPWRARGARATRPGWQPVGVGASSLSHGLPPNPCRGRGGAREQAHLEVGSERGSGSGHGVDRHGGFGRVEERVNGHSAGPHPPCHLGDRDVAGLSRFLELSREHLFLRQNLYLLELAEILEHRVQARPNPRLVHGVMTSF
jgi:integrase